MAAPLEMDPRIRGQWVAALRSGEYEQGTESLFDGGKYCCLGVLCDLAINAGTLDMIVGAYLPEAAAKWAGLPILKDRFDDPISDPTVAGLALSRANDCGRSFADIATAIETGEWPA